MVPLAKLDGGNASELTEGMTRVLLADTQPVSCEGCGACCMHAHEPPFAGVNGVAAGDDPCWDALPESLKSEIVEFRINVRPKSSHDQPCIWLDPVTRLCRHYEYRPRLCRDFELGGKDCLGFRNLHVSVASVRTTLEWKQP